MLIIQEDKNNLSVSRGHFSTERTETKAESITRRKPPPKKRGELNSTGEEFRKEHTSRLFNHRKNQISVPLPQRPYEDA